MGTKVKIATLDGTVELTVPSNSQTGQRLRLRGQGLWVKGSGRGDLYIKLKIVVPTTLTEKERELFTRLAAESRFNPRQSVGGGRS